MKKRTPLIKPLSKEEAVDIEKDMYKGSLEDLNNFRNWFYKIKDGGIDSSKELKVPESQSIDISLDWYMWLKSDNYSDEKIKEFNDYLLSKLSLSPNVKYFMKTGNFSNKFDFSKCMVTDTSNIGAQFLDLFYTSMCVGATPQPTIVIREYIESESKLSIYNGMPLRSEFRYFYDFDKRELLGVAKYWHDMEMLTLVDYRMKEIPSLQSVKDLIEILKESEKRISPLKIIKMEEYLVYREFNESYDTYYSDNKDRIGEILNRNLKRVDLSGKWSVDVMVENGDLYVIDMALMQNSALVDRMEKLNVEIDENVSQILK